MKLAVFSLAVMLSMPVVARAADAYSEPYNWSGFYAGVQVGGRWAEQLVTGDFGRGQYSERIAPNGGLVGGYVGYNFQLDSFVFGAEATIVANSISSTRDNNTTRNKEGAQMLSSLNARLGYAFDRVLIFGTVGLARADYKDRIESLYPPFLGPEVYKYDRNGWNIGVGTEYALTNNLIGRLEYRHFDLGKVDYMGLISNRFRQDTATLGIAYKF